jgi:hypothetical protein
MLIIPTKTETLKLENEDLRACINLNALVIQGTTHIINGMSLANDFRTYIVHIIGKAAV